MRISGSRAGAGAVVRWRNRGLAVGALAAAATGAWLAVSSALDGNAGGAAARPAAKTTSVAFGSARVVRVVRADGSVCFTLRLAGSSDGHACVPHLHADEIAYTTPQHGQRIAGVAGSKVRAVVVRLTGKGTVWATLRGGAFYVEAPGGRRARAIMKWLRDGSRHTFAVT